MGWEEQILKELKGIRRGMEGVERELRLLRMRGLRVTEKVEEESNREEEEGEVKGLRVRGMRVTEWKEEENDRLEGEGEEKKTEDEVEVARGKKEKGRRGKVL
ncbi:hypothetical protein RF55_16170 [Lasius niger]|uniref:Uncharacterized protein n=1 Tax=Lasius niger TaxID=67767 RepID=A0A0J7MY46_LASNI|nr:hypothetical protein RF55_16170 [Lasius niger]